MKLSPPLLKNNPLTYYIPCDILDITMNEYTVTYYDSEEAMKSTSEQVAWAERSGRQPDYNWDNIKYSTISATTLGGAYRAFTMSNSSAIVVGVEDVRTYRSSAVIG